MREFALPEELEETDEAVKGAYTTRYVGRQVLFSVGADEIDPAMEEFQGSPLPARLKHSAGCSGVDWQERTWRRTGAV